MSDRVVVIPKVQDLDFRYQARGDKASGIANIRMRVTLEAPQFAINLGGRELARRVAQLYRDDLSQKLAQGLDAQGAALPALAPQTIERRRRRQRQREDGKSRGGHAARVRAEREGSVSARTLADIETGEATGAKKERLSLKGRGQSGKTEYDVVDITTPMHESGLAAENVVVNFKGTESGDPVFLIAFPSGGGTRGLDIDDGRGARLFAVRHYGEHRIMALSDGMDPFVEPLISQHLDAVLAVGGTFAEIGDAVGEAVDVVDELFTGALEDE